MSVLRMGGAAERAGALHLRLAGVFLFSLCCGAHAAAVPTGTQESDEPSYGFKYSNGLYATIAGFLNIKDVELKSQKTYKLKIGSFKKKFPVKAIIQNKNAPLVVVLLGVDGRADGALGKLWPSWLADAGNHVLTFDSTFLASFIELSGHGVTGNLPAEADRIKDIIAAFLELGEMKGKVTRIGVVGMSYGGLEALLLGQRAQSGSLPFKIDAIQAYSPPINLRKTGELIDRWYEEDRWQYKLTELAGKLSGHKPVDSDAAIPFDDSIMRAGIAAVFRLGLVEVVVRNDKMYNLKALPRGNNFDDEYVRRDHAATWGYSRFMTDLAFPYWKQKSNLDSVDQLVGPAELDRLLLNQLPVTEVILAEDDPFNLPEDLARAREVKGAALTVLPRGGHLGFVNEPWTKARLLKLFSKCDAKPGDDNQKQARAE